MEETPPPASGPASEPAPAAGAAAPEGEAAASSAAAAASSAPAPEAAAPAAAAPEPVPPTAAAPEGAAPLATTPTAMTTGAASSSSTVAPAVGGPLATAPIGATGPSYSTSPPAGVPAMPAQAPGPHSQFASLYVGDLHPDVTEAVLHEAFNTAGNVASCRICRDGATRRSLCYGYVNYYTIPDAERALETLNYSLIKGRPCRVMWSMRDAAARKNTKNNVFVRNLDLSIDNRTLHDTFSIFGNILSCKVATDANGKSKGHGFIHFESEDSAKTAIARVNGMEIAGTRVFVGPFMKREELESTGQDAFTNLYVKHMPKAWDEQKLSELFTAFGEVASSVIMTSTEGKRFALVNFKDSASAATAVEALHRKDMTSELTNEEKDALGLGEKAATDEKDEKEADAPAKENAQEAAAAPEQAEGAEEKAGAAEEKAETADKVQEEAATDEEKKLAAKPKQEDEDGVPVYLLYVQRAQTRAERKAELEKEREKRRGERAPGVRLCVRNLVETTTSEALRKLFEPYGTVYSAIVRSDEETGKCRGFGFVVFSTNEEASAAVSDMHMRVVDGKALNVGLAEKKNQKKGQGAEEGVDDQVVAAPVAKGEKSRGRRGEPGKGKGGEGTGTEGKEGKGKGKGKDKRFKGEGKGKGGRNKGASQPQPPQPGAPPYGVPGAPPPPYGHIPPGYPAGGFPPGYPYPPYGSLAPPGATAAAAAAAAAHAAAAARSPFPPGGPMPPGARPPFPGPSVGPLPPPGAPPIPGAFPPGAPGWPPHMRPPYGPYGAPPMPGSMPAAHPQAALMAAQQVAMYNAARPPLAPMQPAAPQPAAAALPAASSMPAISLEALAALPARQQKQQLGERLFPIVRGHRSEAAGKITGMLLELPNEEIIKLLQSDVQLKQKIDDAVKVLESS